ncbi:tellurite resistance TerB family protein [Tabrizicola thermarum]|uniref:tellurite resistance TerB family protein n=1 Tax=Tabrizicola thermarum TaxID=2670345 RepID=UPI001390209E|nr:tellurite resistance TerB family protein [Tabrizicola thermarum]
MLNAKSLMDSLVGGLSQMTGGNGAKGLADKAKEAWNSQSALGKGAIAGGLLGVLLTRGGRRMLGTGVRIGGMAAIGGLAYKAYEDWKNGRAGAEGAVALPAPEGSAFNPTDAAAADDLATHLLQAMIAAAKADGEVSAEERAAIDAQLATLGLGPEAEALIAAELDAPLDVGRIAALAQSEAEATQLYAATLMIVDEANPAEKGYLAMLAARMKLDQGLVDRLHAEAERL